MFIYLNIVIICLFKSHLSYIETLLLPIYLSITSEFCLSLVDDYDLLYNYYFVIEFSMGIETILIFLLRKIF